MFYHPAQFYEDSSRHTTTMHKKKTATRSMTHNNNYRDKTNGVITRSNYQNNKNNNSDENMNNLTIFTNNDPNNYIHRNTYFSSSCDNRNNNVSTINCSGNMDEKVLKEISSNYHGYPTSCDSDNNSNNMPIEQNLLNNNINNILGTSSFFDIPTDFATIPQPNAAPFKLKNTKDQENNISKSGRWTKWEKLTFLKGLKLHGKGKWKRISMMIPTRSTVQVKTHAQTVLKRVQNGEDVFEELKNECYRDCMMYNEKLLASRKISKNSHDGENNNNSGSNIMNRQYISEQEERKMLRESDPYHREEVQRILSVTRTPTLTLDAEDFDTAKTLVLLGRSSRSSSGGGSSSSSSRK